MNVKDIANVSIVAANYNNGKYLAEFINSILNSTMLPLELIIVDDGSTDNSLSILGSYRELSFLRIIIFEQNRGNPTAVNAGLDVATGKYIMRADPDDRLVPGRIEKQFRFMEDHPEVDILGSNALYFFDFSNSIINATNFPISDALIKKSYRRGEHGVLQATTIVKSEVFKRFRYRNIFPAEDYELFSRMVKDGCRFQNLPEPLYMVRVHAGSSTSNLKIETIRQTFAFRDLIFGTRTSLLHIWIYYQYISHYRSYQMAGSFFPRYMHLVISVLMYPAKLWRRFINKGKFH